MGKYIDAESCWNEFWKPLVTTHGAIDIEQIKKELFDFSNVLDGLSEIYSEITAGGVSKVLTKKSVILELYRRNLENIRQETDRKSVV